MLTGRGWSEYVFALWMVWGKVRWAQLGLQWMPLRKWTVVSPSTNGGLWVLWDQSQWTWTEMHGNRRQCRCIEEVQNKIGFAHWSCTCGACWFSRVQHAEVRTFLLEVLSLMITNLSSQLALDIQKWNEIWQYQQHKWVKGHRVTWGFTHAGKWFLWNYATTFWDLWSRK